MMKLIMLYLLCLQTNRDSFGEKLILKIYGKVSRKNYIGKGLRRFLPHLQREIKDAFMLKLNSFKLKIKLSEIKDFLNKTTDIAHSLLNKRESLDPTLTNEQLGVKTNLSSINVQETKSIINIKENSALENLTIKIMNSGDNVFWKFHSKDDFKDIEPKYIEHWEWLYKNQNFTGNLFFTFDILLKRAYSL